MMGYSPELTPPSLPHGYFGSWGARSGSPATSRQTLRVAAVQQRQGTWVAADLLCSGRRVGQEPAVPDKDFELIRFVFAELSISSRGVMT